MLVIPKEHYPDLAALAEAEDGLLAEVAAQAHLVASAEGVGETGYRVVFNTGPQAARRSATRTRTCWAAGPGLAAR